MSAPDSASAAPEDAVAAAVRAQNQEEALLESWLSEGDRRALEVVHVHAGGAAGGDRPEVSQSAFDDAVKENIDEFEMSLAEAVEDAKATFVMQGMRVPEDMRYGGEDTKESEGEKSR